MGARRDPLGVSAWRSMAHRIVYTSQAPVHSVLVQKSVTNITKLCRPAFKMDARQYWRDSQEENRKKLALGLPATFVRMRRASEIYE